MKGKLCAVIAAGSITCFMLFFNCAKTPTSPNTGSSSDYNSGGTAGAGGSASNPSGAATMPSAQQTASAAAYTMAANEALESAIYAASNSGNGPNVNVSSAEAIYKSALAQNPNNTSAQFGAAVTALLSINQNASIQSVLDSFTVTPSNSLFKSRLLPLGITGNSFKKSGEILSGIASGSQWNLPKISTVQEVVKDTLLPEIVYALDRMSIIENDPKFAFTITPKMRGLAVGDTFVVSRGDIFVIDASLRVVRGILLTLISYNVDIDIDGSYQWLASGDQNLIASNIKRLYTSSQFLALNSWGEASMQAAILNLRECIAKLDSALYVFQNNTGDQVNDIIQTSDITSANNQLSTHADGGPTSIAKILDTASAILNGPYTFTSGGEKITVNLSAIFDNPIQDLKTKFPYIKWRDTSEWDSAGIFQPVYLVNSAGAAVPDSEIAFPDYTFGGLFPNMTTRQDWVNLSNSSNLSNSLAASSIGSGYVGYLRFPFAAALQ